MTCYVAAMRWNGVVALMGSLVGCGSVEKGPRDSAIVDSAIVDSPIVDAGGLDSPSLDSAIDTPMATCAPTPVELNARWRGNMSAMDDTGGQNGSPQGNLGYAPGRHGFAFVFDGIDDAVAVFDQDRLWPMGSFTIEAWVKTATPGPVVQKYQCGGQCPPGLSNAFWQLSIVGAGHASFIVRANADSSSGVVITDTTRVVTDGTWHHLVGVRDLAASQAILYIDGEVAALNTLTDIQRGVLSNRDGETDPVVIGASPIAGAPGFRDFRTGAIDEVAYFTAALTAAEVQAIYAAPDGECP